MSPSTSTSTSDPNRPTHKNVFSHCTSTSSSYFSSSFSESSDGRTQTRSYGETTYTDPAGNTTVHRVVKEPGMAARREYVHFDHLNRKVRASGNQEGLRETRARIEDVTDIEEDAGVGGRVGGGEVGLEERIAEAKEGREGVDPL